MNRLKSTGQTNFSYNNPPKIQIYMALNSQNLKETIKPKSFAYVEYSKAKRVQWVVSMTLRGCLSTYKCLQFN